MDDGLVDAWVGGWSTLRDFQGFAVGLIVYREGRRRARVDCHACLYFVDTLSVVFSFFSFFFF
ncbi:hypothetical protein BDY21DRAFT_355322 [Lineolata rhizophorae]|uniref:Uncharacterized protein n=1 Tax=Lineolata rhizophorae TaxID=578093 RepID=A0A6A6NPA0_9PEZI|nr:hypothetical protein BDY21DRAFT_355322 [Lineolata rhizophorae]